MDLIHNFFLLTQVLIGSVEVCQLRVALSLLKKNVVSICGIYLLIMNCFGADICFLQMLPQFAM